MKEKDEIIIDNDKLFDEIYNKILKLVNAKGTTLTALGELVGHSKNYFYQMKKNRSIPTTIVLAKICDYFGITLSDFYRTSIPDHKTLDNIISHIVNHYDESELDELYYFAVLPRSTRKGMVNFSREYVAAEIKDKGNK